MATPSKEARDSVEVVRKRDRRVRVFGDDYAPLAGIDVAGSVVLVSGEGTATPISGKTDAAGQYTFGLPADSEGTRVIGVEVSAIAEPFGYAEARVTVTDRNGELENPRIQPELMAALAEATGGEVLPTAPDPRDAARKPADSLLATDRHSDPLWSQPALLLLLVLPLGAEWVLRRRLGLR